MVESNKAQAAKRPVRPGEAKRASAPAAARKGRVQAAPQAPNDGRRSIVASVIADRNRFYEDGTRSIARAVVLLVAGSVSLAALSGYYLSQPEEARYFAVTEDWRMKELAPLTQPVMTPDAITDWVAGVMRRMFTLQYNNWRNELQDIQGQFTTSGWNAIMPALEAYGLTEALEKNFGVSYGSVVGQPVVLNDGYEADGRYFVTVQLMVKVGIQTSTQIEQQITLTVKCVRVSETINPRGMAIESVVGR